MKKKITNSDVYEMANEQILAALDRGENPWRKTWQALREFGTPFNLSSGKLYRGSNIIMLGMQVDAPCQAWVTFNQAKDLGGKVKKGAKSTLVVYWKFLKVEDSETGEEKKIPFLRYYRVFNALRDCEGLEDKVKAKIKTPDEIKESQPHETMREWLESEGINLYHGGDRAFYRPSDDIIQMPHEQSFSGVVEYQSTLAHECIHATGHKSRLNRLSEQAAFGNKEYSLEELVAETGACYVAASLGFEPNWDNSAAYLQSWSRKIKENASWFVSASGKAAKAADMILGVPEQA